MKNFTKVALALVLAAATGSFTATSAFAADIPAGTKLAEKQELNYNYGNSPDTIDPTLSVYSDSFSVLRMLFDTLVRQDSHGNYIPWAAEKWETSSDGLTWTFYLRKNAKWTDGKPVTAKDFVYSWQRLTDPKTGAGYADYLATANVKNAAEINAGKKKPSELGVEAKDDYTLVVHLTTPTPWLSQMTTLSVLSPLREDVIKKHGEKWTSVENIVTTGPFKIVTNRLNDTMDFVKWDGHWDAKNTVITKVHFDFINNPLTSYYKYLQGEYPTTGIPVQFKKQVLAERKDELVTINPLSTTYLKFNNKRLSDARVRKALTLLVDRKFFIEKILGFGVATSTVTPPGIKDGQDIKQAAWLERDFKANVEEALSLLKAAGYSKEKPLTVTLLSSSGADKKTFVALSGLWEQNTGGVVILKNEVVESKTWQSRVSTERNYDLTIGGWNADYDQVSTFYNIFTCDSPINDVQYCNPEFDKLVKTAAAEQDGAKRAQLYAKANLILEKDLPVGPLWNPTTLALKSPALQGYNPNNDVRYFYDYYFIAGKKAKGAK
ncbi:peptide ABC transporter substrate-binding protein [Psittacicella hinzii]|uniref:Solute-binding protein family 5 domain-containing protein n=1 Tax=Psittacicella hinzii TaxID=2028575 RepID=A0A3A1YRY0_9GAMM|nr:peptide ABC transporter substrate-binding protein [Psittacicella hinzii]RIY40009.1 hypothetical protein CKF58_01200 [Psittacicella hinzii]